MANKQAPADHLLTSELPTFTTRGELEVWVKQTARWANEAPGQTMRLRLDALDRIERVTIAHLHLPEGEA